MSASPIRYKPFAPPHRQLNKDQFRSSDAPEAPLQPRDEFVPENGAPGIASEASEPADGVIRTAIPGTYIVKIDADQVGLLTRTHGDNVDRILGRAGNSTFLLLHGEQLDPGDIQDLFPGMHVMRNFHYEGKLYDKGVEGSKGQNLPEVPRHLDIINVRPAWQQTRGLPSVLSAVTDTGIDSNHPQLKDSIWVNPLEVAGNERDDDLNGKVDDIIGWDMSNDDNDPHATSNAHHTHVHGIMHARENVNGAAGVAPGARSMALRIAGGKHGYNSAVLVEAYLYALNQGAKAVNTSFNIDGFVGDAAIAETYRALGDNDVLLFNSAGNGDRKNPARSVFEDVVLVASTDTAPQTVDQRSSFSNYGHGIDIAAPGKDVISTIPDNKTAAMSGTSMASPVALGVDALIRSVHPEWNREQRWAQLSGTADNIDNKNVGKEGLFGGGRVNAGRALTETLPPPTLSTREEKNQSGELSKMVVRFDKVFDTASSNTPDSWRILDSQGETVQLGPPKEVRLLTNEIGFDVSALEAGTYKLVASASHLKDPFGTALDGNGDGVAGDDFVKEFNVG